MPLDAQTLSCLGSNSHAESPISLLGVNWRMHQVWEARYPFAVKSITHP
jgi:hypothetical protein